MMQMQEAGRPLWLIRLVNQWNNVAVFGCAVVLAIYTSPPANMLRRWGANQYDSGFVVITWILLGALIEPLTPSMARQGRERLTACGGVRSLALVCGWQRRKVGQERRRCRDGAQPLPASRVALPPRTLLSSQALLPTGTAGQAWPGVQEEEEMTVALRSRGLRPLRSAHTLARFRSAVKLMIK